VTVGFGFSSRDYEEIARKEHLSALELKIRKLYDTAENIAAEQRYQKVEIPRSLSLSLSHTHTQSYSDYFLLFIHSFCVVLE
jgi:hypothetical protein